MSAEWIATGFIGSFQDAPDEALIVLRGDIDAATVQRLGVHIAGVLEAGTRHLRIDAAAVDSYEPSLLELLGRTQHRMGRHRGLLQVRGLHPTLLRSAAAAGPPSRPHRPSRCPRYWCRWWSRAPGRGLRGARPARAPAPRRRGSDHESQQCQRRPGGWPRWLSWAR